MEFTKPAKSTTELIAEWKKRGLLIPDAERAARYLEFIGYYRFSAYTIPFQQTASTHQFKSNTSFDDILNAYVFDRELRLLILDAIERIEVAVRAQITNVIALDNSIQTTPNGAFWYLNPDYFKREYAHMRLLAQIEKQVLEERNRLEKDIKTIDANKKLSEEQKNQAKEKAKKENFLRHYISQYQAPKLPPCWMTMELLTLGELSHLYAGLQSISLKKQIARNLGIHAELLESWLRTFTTIRNFCAHHSRLWNRELGVSPKIPQSSNIKWLTNPPTTTIHYNKRIYSVLIALQTILYTISPYSSWAKRLKQLLDKYPNISIHNMGMPTDWHTDVFWDDALK